jgi:hypothetical protein
MAEFNDATFAGDVSGLDGTFSGTLTAQAINAANNINIAGNSVARTTVSTRALSDGFNDDSIWRSMHSLTFQVPQEDTRGGWMSAAIQYTIGDRKGDNDRFMMEMRIRLNGLVLYTSPVSFPFGGFYTNFRDMYHEVSAFISEPGNYQLSVDFRWHDYPTNMYAFFTNTVIRVDYIRK